MDILKVSAKSRSTAVAGAIAGVIRESGRAEVQAIGAGAVNQAVKAVAIARGYLAEDGITISCMPIMPLPPQLWSGAQSMLWGQKAEKR